MRRTFFLISLVLFYTASGLGQQQTEKVIPQQQEPDQRINHLFELDGFAGGSFFRQRGDAFKTKMVNGGLTGIRLTENIRDKFSLEQSVTIYGVNNLRFHMSDGSTLNFGSRVFEIAINPVFHFTSRLSRVRPFITAGYSTEVFYPTRDAKRQVQTIPSLLVRSSLSTLDTDYRATFNYGGGVKVRFKPEGMVGLRFDVRGTVSRNPNFGLPQTPFTGGVYITRGTLDGLQAVAGLNFWFGRRERTPDIIERERTVTTEVERNAISVSEIQGSAEVCAGSPIDLTVTPRSSFPIRYQWSLNGTPVGGNENKFSAPAPDAGGNQRVSLVISDVSGSPRSAAPATLNYTVRVRPYVRPAVQVAASARDIVQGPGRTLTVAANATGDCGGTIRYTWTASEGTISGNAAQATYDPSSVRFDPATDKEQTKQVTLTVTARDDRGNMASATVPVTVRKSSEAKRLPDILFTPRSSRVNNCGKRILLEEVFPQFKSGNYTLVLVGHSDASEQNVKNLDRDRAYNAAKVLVNGSTQNHIEPQLIRADWTGTNQESGMESAFCGGSTRPASRERNGATISAGDANAAMRRVEVWLVPREGPMPPSVHSPKELPASIRPR